MAKLMDSLGVKAVGYVGHSFGEIVAAHLHGSLSLTNAAQLVNARVKFMS